MSRRAFTLVEILVAATIGLTVFAAALSIFNFGNRSRNVTATARALQTALLVQERFIEDLSRLIPGGPAPIRFHPDRPSRVSFWAYDPVASTPDKVVVRAVVYFLEDNGQVMREWEVERKPLGVAPLKSIAFLPFLSPTGPLVRVSMVVGREPGEPPGPDTVHAFLARIPAPKLHPSLKFDPQSAFVDKADEPKDDKLAFIGELEPDT